MLNIGLARGRCAPLEPPAIPRPGRARGRAETEHAAVVAHGDGVAVSAHHRRRCVPFRAAGLLVVPCPRRRAVCNPRPAAQRLDAPPRRRGNRRKGVSQVLRHLGVEGRDAIAGSAACAGSPGYPPAEGALRPNPVIKRRLAEAPHLRCQRADLALQTGNRSGEIERDDVEVLPCMADPMVQRGRATLVSLSVD